MKEERGCSQTLERVFSREVLSVKVLDAHPKIITIVSSLGSPMDTSIDVSPSESSEGREGAGGGRMAR